VQQELLAATPVPGLQELELEVSVEAHPASTAASVATAGKNNLFI
jgi:hypothetical protein